MTSPKDIRDEIISILGDLDRGMVLYLPLNEGSGTICYDKSGQQNNALFSSVPLWVDGKFGKALSFDGIDDYIESANQVDLNLLEHPVTLECWVYPFYRAVDPSWASWQLVGKWAFIATYIKPQDESNALVGLYLNGVGWVALLGPWEQWYHIVAVYSGKGSAERKLYVNGVLKGTYDGSAAGDYSGTIQIGRNNYVNIPYGYIDDVNVYNRALTEGEIKRKYLSFPPRFSWFKGEPPKSRWPGFPWGWVEWNGGAMEAPVGSKAEIRDSFFVVVVDKHIEADRAEDSVMDFADSVEASLDDSPTIGGLVARSYVVNREKQKLFDGDYSVCALRITLQTHRRE